MIWNISNILSLSRMLLAVPMYFALIFDNKILVFVICVIAYITDLLDGYFARRFNQITEFGKIIDPLADKIFIGMTSLILLLQHRLPLWFAVVIFGRDLLILLGGLYAAKKIGMIIPSNYIGKATVIITGLTLLLIIFDIAFLIGYAILFSTIAAIFSLLIYMIGMINKLSNRKI